MPAAPPDTVLRREPALSIAAGQAIGVFDSGSGGMVTAGFVARMIAEAGFPVATLFFGDTANLPYGTRTQQDVANLSDAIIRRLAPWAPVIGIACNTASAAWRHLGTEGKSGAEPHVFSVVDEAAGLAYARARIVDVPQVHRRVKVVGVLGTALTATIQSHAEVIVGLFRAELSAAIGHELPLIPYAFGRSSLAPDPVAGAVIDTERTPHVAVIREDENAPGGTTRAGIRNWDPPQHLPSAVMVVARDAQKLVAAVDVAHVLDADGRVLPEWRDRIATYVREQARPLITRRATSLILGCTHFEYFADVFAGLLPSIAAHSGIVTPSGALACRLIDAWLDSRRMHPVQPIANRAEAFFSFSGDVPPEPMFRSLGLDHAVLVDALRPAD